MSSDITTPTPSALPAKREWKADKRFSPGVLTLGILGGIFVFIAAIISGFALAFTSSLEESFGGPPTPVYLGMDAETAGIVILITGITASICAITGAAINRARPRLRLGCCGREWCWASLPASPPC